MLAEAVEVIRALFGGGRVDHRGEHFDVESAKPWDLPGTAAFASAGENVRPEDVGQSIPCGDDPELFVEAVRPYEAGFTEIALVQVGGDSQSALLDWAEKTLLPALREL